MHHLAPAIFIAALAAASLTLARPLDITGSLDDAISDVWEESMGSISDGHRIDTVDVSLEGRARDTDFADGSLDFFSRYDCTNPCVDIGYCTGSTRTLGNLKMADGQESAGAWSTANGVSGCWDVPEGTHSVALSVSDGHGYSGRNLTCAEIKEKADRDEWTGIEWFVLESGEGGEGVCNWEDRLPEGLKSIGYNWEVPARL